MMDLEYNFHDSHALIQEVGTWLDQNMSNPPLPEPQRWTLGYSQDGRVGIRFFNDHDATLFALRWACLNQKPAT